jgi:outer membrane protein OmpA-like peptidoglycan-associated protein
MKLKSVFVFIITSIAFITIAFAQTTAIKRGNKLFDNFSYGKAIQEFETIKNKTIDVNRKLATSYLRMGNATKAEDYFAKVANDTAATAADAYNYFYSLREAGKYNESETWIKVFNEKKFDDSRGVEYKASLGSFLKLNTSDGRFKIKNLAINSPQQDFGTAHFGKKIVISSTNRNIQSSLRIWNGNEKNFLNLFEANRDSLNELSNLTECNKTVNKKYHEGPATYNANGTYMVFTRDNYENKSSDGIRKLQLFYAKFINNKWTKPAALNLNNKEYSTGHATLSADGNTMYYASDMLGGKGGTDIYSTTRVNDSTWTTPKNMGSKINTEGNEMFPTIHKDDLLFFASNGHVGLGGLDVFVAQVKNNTVGALQNLGTPINGNKDDFAFLLDDDQKAGYFSSNRTDGKGDDDIYSFLLSKPFKFGKQIKGIAKDKTGAPLATTIVTLYNSKNEIVATKTTNADGTYLFDVENDDAYNLQGTKEKYFDGKNTANTKDKEVVEANVILEKDPGFAIYCLITNKQTKQPVKDVKITLINKITGVEETIITPETGDFMRALETAKLNDKIEYTLKLEASGYLTERFTYKKTLSKPGKYNLHEEMDLSMDKMEIGGDLAKMIDIKPIYFDVNKFNIRPDAAIELDKVIAVMAEYPNLEIELGSHTDCRAPIKYNETLSDKRAKASAAYIQAKITRPERMYGKGYGESKLKNGCACEGKVKSTCSDAEHQENRRTEFIITKM